MSLHQLQIFCFDLKNILTYQPGAALGFTMTNFNQYISYPESKENIIVYFSKKTFKNSIIQLIQLSSFEKIPI